MINLKKKKKKTNQSHYFQLANTHSNLNFLHTIDKDNKKNKIKDSF